MARSDRNARIRLAAFEFLDRAVVRYSGAIPWRELSSGFQFESVRVPLIGPQGIFKPAQLTDAPISITTTPEKPGRPRPYDDELRDEFLVYRYRRDGADHHENEGLRRALAQRIPLIYFEGLTKGVYAAAYPVFVVGDDRVHQTFTVQVDDGRAISLDAPVVAETGEDARRGYITRIAQQRLHQQKFRARVLLAYQESCAICAIRHRTLLDAAHIIPDREERGAPVVSNGLALCKLHHAAFDNFMLGIRPDLVVEVRKDVLDEEDGPMLLHGLQEMHGKRLRQVPRHGSEKPNPSLLEERFEMFQRAG